MGERHGVFADIVGPAFELGGVGAPSGGFAGILEPETLEALHDGASLLMPDHPLQAAVPDVPEAWSWASSELASPSAATSEFFPADSSPLDPSAGLAEQVEEPEEADIEDVGEQLFDALDNWLTSGGLSGHADSAPTESGENFLQRVSDVVTGGSIFAGGGGGGGAWEGMNVDVVERLARQLQEQAEQVAKLAAKVDAEISELSDNWRGPDAQRFHFQWQGQYKAVLVKGAQLLESMAESAMRNVLEQRRISSH